MDFVHIRPILSGLTGAAVAAWLATKWKRFVPAAGNPSMQAHLLRMYRFTTRCNNCLFGAGLLVPLCVYFSGVTPNTDWRPLALGLGSAGVGMALVIAAAPLVVRGGNPVDAFRAYAIAQKSPVIALLPLLTAMACLFPWTIYRLAS